MFSETAELYDIIYGQFKDYPEESRRIHALLERLHPDAEQVLDVACGSGEHARILTEEHGYRVDGIDLETAFVEMAGKRCPAGDFVKADMLDFSLGRSYDVILCLFSSIGYARTLDNVRRAFGCFREHLAPRGLLIVEPWFTPEAWEAGLVHMSTAEGEGMKVCRMSHSTVRDGLSVLVFHYLVGREAGVEHRREVHELGLFTTAELEDAFAKAGLEVVEHDPVGLIGRGLFVARTAPSPHT